MQDDSNIFVVSHRRSGTHLTIDTIRHNFEGVSDTYISLGPILPQHRKHMALDAFDAYRKSLGLAVIKSHEFPDMGRFAVDPVLHEYALARLRNSKVVYAMRDGRDVMVSFFEYRKTVDHTLGATSFSAFLRRPFEGYANPPACWAAHVKAWLSRDDVLPVLYEDTHDDFEGTLARLTEFLGLPRKPEVFDTVISRNAAAAAGSTAVQYRKGVVGDHANYFSAADRTFFARAASEGIALYEACRQSGGRKPAAPARRERSTGVASTAPRFMQINTFYPAYLGDFYEARPHLIDASYDDQINALLDDGFAGSHIFSRLLRDHGFETMQVIANNGVAQGAWQKEHGLFTGKTDSAMAILQQIEHFKPDIVYTTDVETLHSGFFRRLENPPPVLAGWRGFPIPPQTDLSAYDLILTSFDRIFEEARARGAKHVERFHPGYPEAFAFAGEPRKIEWDVLISGTVTHEHTKRVQIINMLAEMSVDPATPFKLGLFLPNASALSPLAQSMNRGARWARDMLYLLRSARIVVNIDVDAFGAQPPNMRLIEATGAGAFLLTSFHPDLSKFFAPTEELETFRTPQELAAKILYLLDNPEQCDAMAKRAQERCLREHGLTKRAAWFADIMRAALVRAGRQVV